MSPQGRQVCCAVSATKCSPLCRCTQVVQLLRPARYAEILRSQIVDSVTMVHEDPAHCKRSQIWFKGCTGGFCSSTFGPEFGYRLVFKWLLWPSPAAKGPERAQAITERPSGNQIPARQSTIKPLKPDLAPFIPTVHKAQRQIGLHQAM